MNDFLIDLVALAASTYLSYMLVPRFLAERISKLLLVGEIRSTSRLLPPSKSFLFKNIKSEREVASFFKEIARENQWKDLEEVPIWLLTGHLITDANPGLRYDPKRNPYTGD
ncbi:MAG: hypothetical protein ACYC7D_15340 [Nitrososphaerales archaeon]